MNGQPVSHVRRSGDIALTGGCLAGIAAPSDAVADGGGGLVGRCIVWSVYKEAFRSDIAVREVL